MFEEGRNLSLEGRRRERNMRLLTSVNRVVEDVAERASL